MPPSSDDEGEEDEEPEDGGGGEEEEHHESSPERGEVEGRVDEGYTQHIESCIEGIRTSASQLDGELAEGVRNRSLEASS